MVESLRWSHHPTDPARVLASIANFAASPALARLVREFGGELESRGVLESLDYLEVFAREHWNFRDGRERNLATVAQLSDSQCAAVASAAAELGFDGAGTLAPAPELTPTLATALIPARISAALLAQPPAQPPALPLAGVDTVIMTGGMVRACIVKPRAVVELIDAGLSVSSVIFLGGFRPFAGDEVALAEALGLRGQNEFDAMVAGVEQAFGLSGHPTVREHRADTQNGSWQEWCWSVHGLRVSVVAAASSAPHSRRAHTADTFRFWADELRTPHEMSLLVMTTPIYVPYQAAVATQTFGVERNLAVQSVAVSSTASDLGPLTQIFGPQQQLQELGSAISALKSLLIALIERGTG